MMHGVHDSSRDAEPLLQARSLENRLRSELEGVQLIAEIGLGTAQMTDVEQAVRDVLRLRGLSAFQRDYPAILLTYLAWEGLRSYGTNDKGNGFWSNLAIRQLAEQGTGERFVEALRRLRLPTFDEMVEAENAHTYVAMILLHAGLPASSATRFADRITTAMSDGFEGPEEVVAAFRRNERRIDDLPGPVRRFVTYGGNLVVDLVGRIVETLRLLGEGRQPDPSLVGLPDELVVALSASANTRISPLGARFPSPVVRLDPYLGVGPALDLPVVPTGLTNALDEWVIDGSDRARVAASTRDSHTVSLNPPDRVGWHVSARRAGHTVKHWRFEVDRAIVFRADGRLAPNQSSVQTSDLLLCPATFEIRGDGSDGPILTNGERFAPLAGRWSTWKIHEIDPGDYRRVWVGRADATLPAERTGVEFGVVQRRLATWVTDDVKGVVSSTGAEVVASPPHLDLRSLSGVIAPWSVSALDGSFASSVANLTGADTGLADLAELVPSDRIVNLDLMARGPLGSDTSLSAVLVPGLELILPDRALAPDEESDVLISAKGLTINGEQDITTLHVPPAERRLQIEVADTTGATVNLEVVVPRVSWRVGDHSFRCDLTTVDLEEVAGLALTVRLGLEASVQLRADVAGQPTQIEGPFTTVGDNGIWVFHLDRFADVIRLASVPKVRLQLMVDHEPPVDVLDVVARYEAHDITAHSLTDDGVSLVELRFSENRRFRNRHLELWSLRRTWEAPRLVAIADDADGHALVELSDTPPGAYLGRMCIPDDWGRPSRPLSGAPDTTVIEVGTLHQQQAHLRSLRPDVPLEAFERILSERGRLEPQVALAVAPEAIQVISALLHTDGVNGATKQDFPAAVETLFTDARTAARAIENSVVLDDKADALRFSIVTLADALGCAVSVGDADPLDRLWRQAPILAAALQPLASDAWLDATGAVPAFATDPTRPEMAAPIFEGSGLNNQFISRSAEQLALILDVLALNDTGPLTYGGFILAMFELLDYSAQYGSAELERWRSVHNRLNDGRCRTDPIAQSFLDALAPTPGSTGWAGLPQDVQAAAFHLTAIPDEQTAAARALFEAARFCPRLVVRTLLVAVVVSQS